MPLNLYKNYNLAHQLIFLFFAIGTTLGVAGQYFAMLLGSVVLFPWLWLQRRQIPWQQGWRESRAHVMTAAGLVVWLIAATFINTKNNDPEPLSYSAGHIFWIVIIPLWVWLRASRPKGIQQNFASVTAIILWVMTGICLLQVFTGWHASGGDMTLLDSGLYRARGFFSHPLTLAYSLLVIWPWVLGQWYGGRRWHQLSLIAAVAFMIWSTASRTVQAVAFAELAVVGFFLFSKTWRKIIAAGAIILATVFGIGVTSGRLQLGQHIVNEQDHFSSYPDDRLAFWDAHWQMIKERPITGHGIHLDTDYREPYYVELGLKDFPKKYEAHNIFLSVWSEGGLIGLGFFVGWFIWIGVWFYRSKDCMWRWFGLLGLAGFVLGGMTQNAFQDSEVRYILALMMALALYCNNKDRHQQG